VLNLIEIFDVVLSTNVLTEEKTESFKKAFVLYTFHICIKHDQKYFRSCSHCFMRFVPQRKKIKSLTAR
jgi:hypothetical protein